MLRMTSEITTYSYVLCLPERSEESQEAIINELLFLTSDVGRATGRSRSSQG